jgi:hypothetical protein
VCCDLRDLAGLFPVRRAVCSVNDWLGWGGWSWGVRSVGGLTN